MTDAEPRGEHRELLVIDKVYDLVLWSCRHLAGFPRAHRFTLGERMERRLYDLLEASCGRSTAPRSPLGRQAPAAPGSDRRRGLGGRPGE